MRFVKESRIQAAPERVFAFHELPDAIERLTPEDENATVIKRADIAKIGDRAVIQIKILGIFPVRWVAEHTAYDPPRMFEDVQISGPFNCWQHRHIVEADDSGAILRDEIEYEPPIGLLGRMAVPFAIEPKLQSLFDFRHNVTRAWCEGG